MANLMVGYQFRSDTAYVGGGRHLNSFPVTNMQVMPFAKKTKTKGLAVSDATFHVHLSPVRPIQIMLLMLHQITQSGQIRIRGTTTPAWENVSVNGAHSANDTTISVTKTGDAVLTAGDILSFGDDDTVYKVVEGATLSSGSPTQTITIEVDGSPGVGLSAALTDDDEVVCHTGDYTDPEYDSEWHDVWPTIYSSEVLLWEDSNWWTGKLLTEDAVGYPINYWNILDAAVVLDFWKFEVDDPENYNTIDTNATDIVFDSSDDSINSTTTDLSRYAVGQTVNVSGSDDNEGDFTVLTTSPTKLTVAELVEDEVGMEVTLKTGNINIGSRLIMSPVFQPGLNMVVGSKLRFVPRSDKRESRNGTDYVKNYSNKREFTFAWDGLTKAEAFSGVADIQLRKGDFGDVVVIPDPEDDQHMHVRMVFGKMSEPADIDNPFFGRYSNTMTVKEAR